MERIVKNQRVPWTTEFTVRGNRRLRAEFPAKGREMSVQRQGRLKGLGRILRKRARTDYVGVSTLLLRTVAVIFELPNHAFSLGDFWELHLSDS